MPPDAAQAKMPFGKHKGKTLEWIADNDLLYLDWLSGIELRGRLETAVQNMCDEYAHDISAALQRREDNEDAWGEAIRPAFDDEWGGE